MKEDKTGSKGLDPMSSFPDRKTIPLSLEIYGEIEHVTSIFYWFTTAILLTQLASIVIGLATNNVIAAKIIAVSIPPVVGALFLIHSKKFEAAAAFLTLILLSILTILATYGLGIHQISNLGFPAILIIASLVTKRRTMILLTLYTIGCLAWLVFGELAGVFTPLVLVRSVPGDFFSASLAILVTAFMVRFLAKNLFQSNARLQTELKERRIAEEKYRNIFENAIEGIFQSTADGRFVSVNPAMARMYGYNSSEEMVQEITNISDQLYVEPDLRNDLRHRLAFGQQITGFESQDYRRDGSTFWTSTNIQAILDAAGNILYYEGTVEDITSRKMTDEILRESEERFRTLFNRILDGIYRSSHDGRFLDVNPAMIRMFGYDSREEMLAVDIKKELYFAPEERESLFLDTGQEKVDEFRMRRKDGSEIWVEDHGHYVHDDKGNVLYHEGILRDITERKRMEELLRESEERHRKAQEVGHIGSWEYDIKNDTFWGSDEGKKVYGFNSETDIFTAEQVMNCVIDRNRVNQALIDLIEKNEPYNIVFDIIPLNSSDKRTINSIAELIRDENGNPIKITGVMQDITERKQAENEREQLIHELAAKNAESETLRESFAAIVGIFEFSEIIQHILDQIKRVIPYDSASVWKLEGNIQKFISGRDLPPIFSNEGVEFITDETNSALPILKGEVPYILNNNVQEELADFKQEPHTYVNSWLAIPLKTRGKIIGLIALDGKAKGQFNEHHAELAVVFANQVAIALENAGLVSELQSDLAVREKLIQDLESKNAELEQFTYTVSHDLKSPLVTINGFLGYLEGDASTGNMDRIKTDIQRIQEAVNKMHLLLKELLELSRVGRLISPPEKILFEDLVHEALGLVHGQIEAGKVSVYIQPNLPTVYGDRQRLIEVLQNLIDNSAKYMGDQPNPHIEIGQRGEENSRFIFFVKDNGIGISPEYHNRIFGLFDKLDPRSDGTGVGLALVKRIIEVHGGRIWVESNKENGTTILFSLPQDKQE